MRATALLFIVICFLGCTKDSLDDLSDIRNFHILYSTGSGWTGWRYELNIDTTGVMSIHEISPFEGHEKSKNYTLLTEEIDSIKRDLINLSRIRLDNYGFGPEKPTDFPTTFFKYRLNSCSDSSCIYVPDEGEVPEELSIVLERITGLQNRYDTID